MSTQIQTDNVAAPTLAVADFLDKEPPEVKEAKLLAIRYRLPYIDLLPTEGESPVDIDELAKLPVDMMLRDQLVPLAPDGNNLPVAMAAPNNF